MNLLRFGMGCCFGAVSGRQIANTMSIYGGLRTGFSFFKGSYHRAEKNLTPVHSADLMVLLKNGSKENQGKNLRINNMPGLNALFVAESFQ